jgi:hypothetical protein
MNLMDGSLSQNPSYMSVTLLYVSYIEFIELVMPSNKQLACCHESYIGTLFYVFDRSQCHMLLKFLIWGKHLLFNIFLCFFLLLLMCKF